MAEGAAGAVAPLAPLPAFNVPTAQGYTRWRFTFDGYVNAAIPLAAREGGILVALPLAAIASEDLEAADATLKAANEYTTSRSSQGFMGDARPLSMP